MGCRSKTEAVPSWRKTFYLGSCKWVEPCRNGLGTVPKIWRAVPIFSACKWGSIGYYIYSQVLQPCHRVICMDWSRECRDCLAQ